MHFQVFLLKYFLKRCLLVSRFGPDPCHIYTFSLVTIPTGAIKGKVKTVSKSRLLGAKDDASKDAATAALKGKIIKTVSLLNFEWTF